MAPKFKKDKHGLPDPLHFDLGHTHLKLLELLYVLAIVGAMICILIYGTLVDWPNEVKNVSITMMMVLAALLFIVIFEKSLVAPKAHKAGKPSS